MADELYSALLSIGILIGLGLWIYTKWKHQTLRDTIIEIKELGGTINDK